MCEQLPGANSSPIVKELRRTCDWRDRQTYKQTRCS